MGSNSEVEHNPLIAALNGRHDAPMTNTSKVACLVLVVAFTGAAYADSKEQTVARAFYTRALTVTKGGDPEAAMNQLLADGFKSIGSHDSKSKAELTGQIKFFWKLVPDLKWEVQEVVQDGNRVVVRSIASGTPKGDFMGMKLEGKKSFKIMTIDIHTIERGQIKEVYHLEDWATAMQQLR
jgi:predicted ester cyclase